MAARKCFASLTTVKLLTLEKVITLSGMALTEKDLVILPSHRKQKQNDYEIFNTKILQNTFLSNKHTSFASKNTTFPLSVFCICRV